MELLYLQDESVSYSRIRTKLDCGYKYDLCYNKGIVSRRDDPAPTLGSAGHAGMAAGIAGNNVDEALELWKQDYIRKHSLSALDDPQINDALDAMTDEVVQKASIIVPRALKHLILDEWETVEYKGMPLIEAKFSVPVYGFGRGFNFVVDWVAKHKPTGMTWVIDHKFRKVLQSDEVEEMNLQLPSYQLLLSTMGVKTVGHMSNQILAKLPSEPSRNKDGTMSRAKISTSWEAYERALLRVGLDPKDYLEMKGKLTTEFFRCTYTYRSETQLVNIWNNVIESAIHDMAHGSSYIRNMGQLGCRNCWARDYCTEELRGGDLQTLMETQYMPRNTEHHDAPIFNAEDEEGGEE